MAMNGDVKPLKKPTVYDELYPGRFLKAGEFLGKKVQLTIADIEHEKLIGDDGKEQLKVIVSFKETQKKLVACKTNGMCFREMFGKVLADWIGKRVILFPDTWNGEECIRCWGSPDIAEEKDVTVSLPRRRPFVKHMHKTIGGKSKSPARTEEYNDPGPPDDFDAREAGQEG
jgi:hypothetical protein